MSNRIEDYNRERPHQAIKGFGGYARATTVLAILSILEQASTHPIGRQIRWAVLLPAHKYGNRGSGCSVYESKPSWQTDSGCSRRTVADVSATADPATGPRSMTRTVTRN